MILTTSETISGHHIQETLGEVCAQETIPNHSLGDIKAKRSEIFQKLLESARELHADAILNLQFICVAGSDNQWTIACRGRAVSLQFVEDDAKDYKLYGASVIVMGDWFASLLNPFKKLLGKDQASRQQLFARGQAEALEQLRMKAERWGSDEINDLRVESVVGDSMLRPQMEIYAYGTASKSREDLVPNRIAHSAG